MSGEIKKAVRWYQSMKTWKVVMAVLTPVASGEVLAFFAKVELPVWVHTLVGGSALLLLYVKIFVKDENNDGIVD